MSFVDAFSVGLARAADHVAGNNWTITTVDPEVLVSITGQFQPDQGMQSGQTPNTTASSTAGSSEPALQWVAGGAKSLSFASSFVSRHALHDIRPLRDRLQRLREQDPTLGRAPRVSLAWGDDELTGFVTKLGIRVIGLWATGLPKVVAFDLEVTGAPDVSVQPFSVDGETQFLRLVGGDTFEALGQRYLRSPTKGELIRRINPELAREPEAAGDLVRIFEREHPAMRGRVEPQGVPFLATDGGSAAERLDVLALERLEANGLPYELLPEVLEGRVGS